MTPEEAVTAAKDLNANFLLPSHTGRFTIARHPWDEPLRRVISSNEGGKVMLLTPIIGEQVIIASEEQNFSRWWEIK